MVDLDELERWSKPPAEPWKGELVRQCNCECWNNGHECLEDAIEALETATKGDG